MNVFLRMAALIAVLMLPNLARSQDSNLGNWLIYIGNKKLDQKWNLHHEIQYRNYNFLGDLEQLLVRTGVGYTFDENRSNLLLGYGYILSENYIEPDSKVSINEHRIFQQFTTKQAISSLKLSHRYRFEQRFVGSNFKMRFRYFLSLNYPLNFGTQDSSRFYLSAYNEIFLNTQSAVFDRNRVYVGLGYQLSKEVKIELGYMNQFFDSSGRDQLNIITFANF